MRIIGGKAGSRVPGVGRRRLAIACAVAAASVTATTVAVADQVFNTLDGSVDALAEQMPLNVGGPDGATTFAITPQDAGDAKSGCNFGGGGTMSANVSSSNTLVATASASTVTFSGNGCGLTAGLSIHPVAAGTTTITLSQGSINNTGGTFNFAAATFVVTVTGGTTNAAPGMTISGVTNGASYDKGSVPVAVCEATDDEDGPQVFTADLGPISGPYASDGIGIQEASCSYTDSGGLTASASATYSIGDPSAPTVGYDLTPPAADGDGGWYRSDVSLAWNVGEPQSPNSLVKIGCLDVTIDADQPATAYDCTATSAGGTTGPMSVSIKRDATAPTFDCGTHPSGWQASNVTLSCAAEDLTSGLRSAAAFTLATTLAAGSESAAAGTGSALVEDNAGNSATAGAYSFRVDRKAPTVTATCPTGDVVKGSSASATWTAADGGSGVAGAGSGSVALGTSTVGIQTATVPAGAAVDNVANASAAASCSYRVIYNWTGFFQPIDNLPTINQVNAGRTIPAKFSLGGDQGLSIMAAGYPQSIPVTCASGAAIDTLEELSTATVSGLKYDAVADQYIYNWKTLSTYANSCRKLVVKLVDGTEHYALFKFVK